jgi:hypothetical protein
MADAKILSAVNSEDSYRAKDSLEMFNGADHEESAEDLELNEILWRSIRGAHAPLPDTPGVLWSARR